MKYLLYLFTLLCLFISSCGTKQNEGYNQDSKKDSIAPVNIPVTNKEITGKVIPAGKPKVVTAGKPSILATNTNIQEIGSPQSFALPENLKTISPGTDTFKMPTVVPATGKKTLCTQPVPVNASAPRFKDAAICSIQYMDVDQGLISPFIKTILEDKNGNIWFGSTAAGVCFYNGRSFLSFTEKNGLSNNSILSLLEDKNGNIWIGTDGGGVCCYDGKSFTRFSKNEGLSDNTVLSMCEDKQGNIWFGTNGGGVNRYDGKTFTQYTEKQGLLKDDVRSILEDNSGKLWFGTNGGGVCSFDGKTFTHITADNGLADNTVLAMLQDKKGNIWMATDAGGVSCYEKFASGRMGFTNYTEKEGLGNNSIISLKEDNIGNLWFGTYGSGVTRFDSKTFTHFTEKEGLSNNFVLSINTDDAGNIWFGTYGGGVCRYDTKSFSHFTAKEGLSNNTVRGIVESKNGDLWFGIHGDGVCRYDGKSFAHYTEKEGLSNKFVKSVVEDKNGNQWFVTDGGGVNRFDGKTFSIFTTEEGFISDYVICALCDKAGNIWFGTDEGVCKYDGSNFTNFTEEEGISSNDVSCLLEDKKGNIWIGTNGSGIDRYNGAAITHFTEKEGLANNTVKTIFEDKKGNIWMGTDGGGLSCYNEQTGFITYSEKQGLSSNNIRSILEDKTGNLWIGTAKGLNYAVLANGTPEVYIYGSANGLKANDFFANSALIDSKNRAWWGTGKALSTLDLNSFTLSGKLPLMHLNSLELEQTFIDFYSLHDSLHPAHHEVGDKIKKSLDDVEFTDVASFNNYPLDLKLPHYLDHITFHFEATDWAAPEKVKYQYMIEGLEKDWSPITYENKAVYSNLPHGKFTFKVKAIGIANKWSEVFEYNFKIQTPWWKTAVAYIIYILGFIGIVFGFNNIRTRQLKQRQQQLEQTVKERTHEVVQQKELIEEKQKEIVDSINYAKRIQYTLLAHADFLKQNLTDHFVLFQPKDIVSGDFYWATKKGKRFYLAVCDSTGHGVPGAFMSLLNISFLNEAISEKNIASPDEILNYVREKLVNSISVDGAKDGMDGILLCIEGDKISYAAANNSPVLVSEGNLLHLPTDKMPIGQGEKTDLFKLQTIDAKKGDTLFLYTDGYADQFGGPKGKKLKYKQLDSMLQANVNLSMEKQKDALSKHFNDWKGNLEQVDDVLLIAIHF